MQRFDLVDSQTASAYPGHVIVVAGDDVRTTGELVRRFLGLNHIMPQLACRTRCAQRGVD